MRTVAVLCMFLLMVSVHMAEATDIDSRVTESRAITAEFMKSLKEALQQAMKEGGPVNAIKVCRASAPAIAKQQSEKHGGKIGRTSLKLRNPENAPDAWELETLKSFEARKLAGDDIGSMERAEVVSENGSKSFRYMKAIPTAEICTKCHGTALDPAVSAELDAVYPEDHARGFNPGDIRGAFTIIQPL